MPTIINQLLAECYPPSRRGFQPYTETMKSKSSSPTSEPKVRLRVGLQDVDHETFANVVTGRLGKQRVSIMLDSAVVEFFKDKAGERGYQTMINQALHQVMHSEQLETALRRVIREELSRA